MVEVFSIPDDGSPKFQAQFAMESEGKLLSMKETVPEKQISVSEEVNFASGEQ